MLVVLGREFSLAHCVTREQAEREDRAVVHERVRVGRAAAHLLLPRARVVVERDPPALGAVGERQRAELGALAEAITNNIIYRLRIAEFDDGTIKFKVNEGMWTPPISTEDN